MPSVSRSIHSFPMSEASVDVGMDENTRRVFETIRGALAADAVDPFDRDAFLMHRAVVELIHGGRPPEGVGEAIDELTAWTHLAYLYWSAGEKVEEVGSGELSDLMGTARPPVSPSARLYKSQRLGQPVPGDGVHLALRLEGRKRGHDLGASAGNLAIP